MSTRRNWDSPNPSLTTRQRVCHSPLEPGGHASLRVRGWGSPNSDDRRKSLPLSLCLLCGKNCYLKLRQTGNIEYPSTACSPAKNQTNNAWPISEKLTDFIFNFFSPFCRKIPQILPILLKI